jgi:adhesin transport system outer membrane protein
LIASALLYAAAAGAQSNEPLKAAVQKALDTSPDVTARFNAYRAANEAVNAARGGFYPRLDLSADVGRDRDRIESRIPEEQTISRSGGALTLTQLLWDGLATSNEVGRLGHDRLARYFDVLDVSEQTALEAARAYYDVLRYRRLVQLAEDNYVQHRGAFNLIQSRFKAGVGRGVDLEQAGARLALAESNLNTELSNLHDVAARYQRTIGEVPPANLPAPTVLTQSLPTNPNDASTQAIQRSASVSASIEALRSARGVSSRLEAAYQPKVEARLRSGGGNNFDGVQNQRRDTTAEIVLNWNLFNGGADRARVRQQVNLVNQAADLRDKACRDVRQTMTIAYNDTRKLRDQLQYLDRNTLAIEKARDAYRQQFEIGQRSLLDLLNSENELYTARRSYANADFDLSIAYLRTHAAMNQLTAQLGLARSGNAAELPAEAQGWNVGEDAPTRCPAVTIETPVMDLTALDKRVVDRGVVTATPSTSAVTTPATPLLAPAAPVPVGATAIAVKRVADWAAAWQAKDVQRYLDFYVPGFVPAEGGTNEAWRARRRGLVGKAGPISVKIDNLQATAQSADSVETSFTQTYHSNNFSDTTRKVLVWQRIKDQWFIVKETSH